MGIDISVQFGIQFMITCNKKGIYNYYAYAPLLKIEDYTLSVSLVLCRNTEFLSQCVPVPSCPQRGHLGTSVVLSLPVSRQSWCPCPKRRSDARMASLSLLPRTL